MGFGPRDVDFLMDSGRLRLSVNGDLFVDRVAEAPAHREPLGP